MLGFKLSIYMHVGVYYIFLVFLYELMNFYERMTLPFWRLYSYWDKITWIEYNVKCKHG